MGMPIVNKELTPSVSDQRSFNIGHAVKHLENFRETGDIEELRKVNKFLEEHLKFLESKQKRLGD
jgi:hypothetical protein